MASDKQNEIGFTDRKSARFRHAEKTREALALGYNFGILDAVSVSLLLGIGTKTAANFLRDLSKKKVIERCDAGLFGFIFYRLTSLGVEKISGELPEYLAGIEPPNLKTKAGFKAAAHNLLSIIAALELGPQYASDGDFYIVSDRVLRLKNSPHWGEEWGNFYPDVLLFARKKEGDWFKVAIELQQQYESETRLKKRLQHYAWAQTKTHFSGIEFVSTVPSIAKKYLEQRCIGFKSYSDYNHGWFDKENTEIIVEPTDDDKSALRLVGEIEDRTRLYATSLSRYHAHYYGN